MQKPWNSQHCPGAAPSKHPKESPLFEFFLQWSCFKEYAPSLGAVEAGLDGALGSLFWRVATSPRQRVGTGWALRSLPTWAILWFPMLLSPSPFPASLLSRCHAKTILYGSCCTWTPSKFKISIISVPPRWPRVFESFSELVQRQLHGAEGQDRTCVALCSCLCLWKNVTWKMLVRIFWPALRVMEAITVLMSGPAWIKPPLLTSVPVVSSNYVPSSTLQSRPCVACNIAW